MQNGEKTDVHIFFLLFLRNNFFCLAVFTPIACSASNSIEFFFIVL